MNDRGWVFADVLVALALVAVTLGFLFPALDNLRRVEARQVEMVFRAAEAPVEDAWKAFR
jgi:hypothetical protein